MTPIDRLRAERALECIESIDLAANNEGRALREWAVADLTCNIKEAKE